MPLTSVGCQLLKVEGTKGDMSLEPSWKKLAIVAAVGHSRRQYSVAGICAGYTRSCTR